MTFFIESHFSSQMTCKIKPVNKQVEKNTLTVAENGANIVPWMLSEETVKLNITFKFHNIYILFHIINFILIVLAVNVNYYKRKNTAKPKMPQFSTDFPVRLNTESIAAFGLYLIKQNSKAEITDS